MNNDTLIIDYTDILISKEKFWSTERVERELDWVEVILGRNDDYSFDKKYEEAINYMSNLLAKKIDDDIINELMGNWNQTNRESEM